MALLGVVAAIDAALARSVRLAMKRADLTLDYVSRVTGIPIQRLSDQLNGKTPFTGFCRFFSGEMRETDFLEEWLAIVADGVGRIVLPRGVQLMVVSDAPKRMAKADLALPPAQAVSR